MQPVRALQSTGKSKACFTWHYAFVKNSKTKIVLNLEDEEAQRVQHILNLSDTEIMNITHFARGNGLILTNNNTVTVEFKASGLETEMITTDREQLREMIRRKQE